MQLTELPDYNIRVSPRARNISIHVSLRGEVEVVVPQGFDQRRIPEIIERRQDWIARTQKRLEAERQSTQSDPGELLPQQISLRSLAEEWTVTYRPSLNNKVIASTSSGNRLNLQGSVSNIEACQQVLQRWLNRKAKLHFTPWLRQISKEVALPFDSLAVRHQKTLWASCSSKKTISLNAKLLFLPPALVRYVFIHELCHTIHLNHSAKFWALVAEKEPDYQHLDRELRKAWKYVPPWAEEKA